MKREIKFRGFRTDGKGWVEGDLIHGVNHKRGKIFILPVQGGVMALGHGLDPLDGYEVYPESVGQYTGLKDKNGKEVYEGDIVELFEEDVVFAESANKNFAVQWGGDYPAFELDGYEDLEYNSLQHACNVISCAVVGNIHENPKLLSKK